MTSKIKISIDKMEKAWPLLRTFRVLKDQTDIISKNMRHGRHNQKTEHAENRFSWRRNSNKWTRNN